MCRIFTGKWKTRGFSTQLAERELAFYNVTNEIIKYFEEYYKNYSKPRKIVTDRGTGFTSDAFKQFLADESITYVLIAVGTPRENGQADRFNRVIVPMLAKLVDEINIWDRVLDRIEFALNNSVSQSTKKLPSELLFGVRQIGESMMQFV